MLPKLLGLVLGLILAPGARAACAFTNCDGAYTCDYWSYGWTCAALEADYGCDCTDCACGETVETAVSTEADIHAALADHSIDIVTIEEGTYALSKTLQINRPVTVQAAPGATVTLDAQQQFRVACVNYPYVVSTYVVTLLNLRLLNGFPLRGDSTACAGTDNDGDGIGDTCV